MTVITTIEDLRVLAQKRVPRMFYDYADSGSWTESTYRANEDDFKAIALGAKGTYIGRSFLYGLGAMGEAGVTRALEIIHKELDLTMAFCGHTDIQRVDQKTLLPGTF